MAKRPRNTQRARKRRENCVRNGVILEILGESNSGASCIVKLNLKAKAMLQTAKTVTKIREEARLMCHKGLEYAAITSIQSRMGFLERKD